MSTETERINIAGNVRRLRRVRVLTQAALAERSGLCQSRHLKWTPSPGQFQTEFKLVRPR